MQNVFVLHIISTLSENLFFASCYKDILLLFKIILFNAYILLKIYYVFLWSFGGNELMSITVLGNWLFFSPLSISGEKNLK